jgi:hypothetical protein
LPNSKKLVPTKDITHKKLSCRKLNVTENRLENAEGGENQQKNQSLEKGTTIVTLSKLSRTLRIQSWTKRSLKKGRKQKRRRQQSKK